MTRTHASAYTAPEDPYAHARCECGHFVSKGQPPSRRCQYAAEGCTCVDHRLREVSGDGPETV
jgi:hypothetical protein